MANLAAKYRPQKFSDMTEQSVIVNMMENICSQDNLSHRNFLFIGPAGCGKAQPLDSKILTPKGFILMQDVKIGTEVFTHKGNIAKVSDIYPQGVRPIYEIQLQDRTKIKVSDEHLNIVYTYDSDTNERENYVLTTMELKNLFETSEPHLRFNFYLPQVNWEISNDTDSTNLYKLGVNCIIDNISIPEEYLLSSKLTREYILQGLLDTRGYIDADGYLCWKISNNKLSDDFAFLVRSLGIRDTIDIISLGSKTKETSYIHTLLIPESLDSFCYESFETPIVLKDTNISRRIISIKRCKDEECQCIMLDHEDHTYISDGFIPTHNTTSARIVANTLNDGKGSPIEVDAASNNGVENVRELVKQMKSYPVGCKYKVFIFDECFPGNSLIHTTIGMIPIKDIEPGTIVYNLTGESKVRKVFHNQVKVSNLICLKIKDRQIITTKDHLFFTDDGWVSAKDLKQGDILYDYTEMRTMREEFFGNVSQRYEKILQQGMQIPSNVRTSDRETCFKYIQNMSNLWERFLDSEICRFDNVLQQVCSEVEEATSELGEVESTTCKTLAVIYLSSMWERNGNTGKRSSSGMFSEMFQNFSISESKIEASSTSCDQTMRRLWEFISSELRKSKQKNMQSEVSSCFDSMEKFSSSQRDICQNDSKNEREQSCMESRISSKTISNKKEKWYVDSDSCYELWKRTLFYSSDSFETRIRRGMEIRISDSNRCKNERQSETLSYELQSRPVLTKIEIGNRGGWSRPQWEIATVARQKESRMPRKFRVDNIEIYQRGHNDELFQSSFSDTKICDVEYVDMYDLEIEGHPSYYVEDILVHNCHAFSSSAWQAMLKPIEEQPAKTVLMLCTTNPEKIPATILSRVQTFQLSKISLNGIVSRLKYIVEQEKQEGKNITYNDDAIAYIAKLANGGMRDAITLLEKSLSYSLDITVENLVKSLDLPNYDDYFILLNGIAKKDNQIIVSLINDVYNSGVNFVKWFEGFHSFVANIIKYIFIQDINSTIIPGYYQDKIANYGVGHATLCLKLANKLVKMNQELKSTQYLQELAITYLCSVPSTK